MGNAVVITGFSNWEKTTIIINLFNGRKSFYQDAEYNIPGMPSKTRFTVDTHSNDDYRGQGWLDIISERLNNSPTNGSSLLTALCPSIEESNDFVKLLNEPHYLKDMINYIFFLLNINMIIMLSFY